MDCENKSRVGCDDKGWVAEIQVRRIRMVNGGTLKGVAEVQVGPFIIRALRIIEDGKGMWVSWPQDRFRTAEGVFRYLDIVQPTREIAEAVSEAIKKVWEKNCRPFLDG
jgi:DNA-binding cell septation regulator SpoVG